MLSQINLLDGIITYDNISWLNNDAYENNRDTLTEDLLQISYFNEKYIIDIGWYPELNKNGQFTIMIIYFNNWIDPLYTKKTDSFKDLPLEINKCIEFIYQHSNFSA